MRKSLLPAMGLICFLTASPVGAETLSEALALAYQTNPTIRAERARLKATRESRAQAWAGALPQISATGSYSNIDTTTTFIPEFGGGGEPLTADLQTLSGAVSAEQPVFTGFRNFNTIKQAAARIRAGGAQLAGVEQEVLRGVAESYFGVRLARAVFDLNKRNVDVLIRQRDLAQARFDVGEITRTDVAQSAARLAAAQADLANAQGDLAVSRAAYARLVGQMPGDLAPVETLPEIPDSEEAAQSIARQYAPRLIGAREQSEISRRQVKVARGALLPTVSLVAGYQYADEPSNFVQQDEQFSYGARANVPIFSGGLNYSRVREAKAIAASDRAGIVEAEREVTEAVTAAWERMIAAKVAIDSTRAAVDANRLASEGVRQEALLGTRTTLDALDAEQELLNSEVALAAAERDAQNAAYGLLAAIGLLTPEALGIDSLIAAGDDDLLKTLR